MLCAAAASARPSRSSWARGAAALPENSWVPQDCVHAAGVRESHIRAPVLQFDLDWTHCEDSSSAAAQCLCRRQTCMFSGLPNAGSAAAVASGQGIELDHLQVALQACPGAQCIMKDACKTILGIEAALVSVGSRNSERRFWCLSRGANVVVNYAGSKDAAEAVAKEIEGMGVKAMAVKVFLSFLFQSLLLIPRVQRWHGSMLTASFWIFPSCFSLDLSSRPSHTFQICASMHN